MLSFVIMVVHIWLMEQVDTKVDQEWTIIMDIIKLPLQNYP